MLGAIFAAGSVTGCSYYLLTFVLSGKIAIGKYHACPRARSHRMNNSSANWPIVLEHIWTFRTANEQNVNYLNDNKMANTYDKVMWNQMDPRPTKTENSLSCLKYLLTISTTLSILICQNGVPFRSFRLALLLWSKLPLQLTSNVKMSKFRSCNIVQNCRDKKYYQNLSINLTIRMWWKNISIKLKLNFFNVDVDKYLRYSW